MPVECPACESPVHHVEGEIGHYCLNLNCPDQQKAKLKKLIRGLAPYQKCVWQPALRSEACTADIAQHEES